MILVFQSKKSYDILNYKVTLYQLKKDIPIQLFKIEVEVSR